MGSVECQHRHLVDTVVSMLQHASMPDKFWDLAVMAAGFLYNRNPSVLLDRKSPIEAFWFLVVAVILAFALTGL